MAEEVKEYTSPVVQDTPFPQSGEQNNSESGGGVSGGSVSSPTVKDTPFPIKTVARELISTVLNTASKTIEDIFTFTQMGAIQMGKFVQSISGEIKISPNGILARNKDGLTSFFLDAITGDAYFQGTVTAGGFNIIDDGGIVSATAFQSGSYRSTTELEVNGSQDFTLVSGSTLNINLLRETKVLITFFANTTIEATDAIRNYTSKVGISIDDSNPGVGGGTYSDVATFELEGVEVITGTCLSFAKTYLIPAGDHTLTLKWSTFSDVGSSVFLRSRGLDYCMLGS